LIVAAPPVSSLFCEMTQEVACLVARLSDAERSVREQAAKAIGRLGASAADAAAPALTRCLRDSDAGVRKQAVRALGKMGEAAAPYASEELLVALQDDSDEVRAAAAGATGWLSEDVGVAVMSALKHHLQDRSARVRIAAAGSYGRLGRQAASGVAEALAACLGDADVHVRVAAAGAVVQHMEAIAAALVARLEDTTLTVRLAAARAIGQMGEAMAVHTESALLRALADPDADVRAAAKTALVHVGKEDSARKVEVHHGKESLEAAKTKVKFQGSEDSPSCRRPKLRRGSTWSAGAANEAALPRLLGTPKARQDVPSFGLPPSKGDRPEPETQMELA